MNRIAVLGGTGQIGGRVVQSLLQHDIDAVSISRSSGHWLGAQRPESVRVESYEYEQLVGALKGSGHVITTLGLPYSSALWESTWPGLVAAVLRATEQAEVPLTVLDNMYVYGDNSPVSEQSRDQPVSRKGRARLAGWNLLKAARGRGQDVVVCRAADFLGPGMERTILPWRHLVAALRANHGVLPWLGRADALHSFAHPVEVAGGLVCCSQDARLRTQPVLHLPTIAPFTGRQLVEELSKHRSSRVRLMPIRSGLVSLAGVASVAAREVGEMMYQSENEFIVDDSRYRAVARHMPRRKLAEVVLEARQSPFGP